MRDTSPKTIHPLILAPPQPQPPQTPTHLQEALRHALRPGQAARAPVHVEQPRPHGVLNREAHALQLRLQRGEDEGGDRQQHQLVREVLDRCQQPGLAAAAEEGFEEVEGGLEAQGDHKKEYHDNRDHAYGGLVWG